jgi:hypothetical protein
MHHHVTLPNFPFDDEAWPADTVRQIEAIECELRDRGIARAEVRAGEGQDEIGLGQWIYPASRDQIAERSAAAEAIRESQSRDTIPRRPWSEAGADFLKACQEPPEE